MDIPDTQQVKYAWRPRSVQQQAFIEWPGFEVMYGGSRGGGKTDGSLGLNAIRAGKYRSAYRGLFLRKHLTDLEDAISRAKEIYLPIGADWHEQKKKFTFPGGGELTFAYLKADKDAEKYQGMNLCVALGTKIRMADGTHKPIEQMRPGDMVSTLIGPKPVLDVTAPYVAPCVRAVVRGSDGEVLGEQIHPVWHPVLSTDGLISSRKKLMSRIFQPLARVVSFLCKRAGEPLLCGHRGNSAWCAWSEDGRSDCTESGHSLSKPAQPESLSFRVALHAPDRQSKSERACHASIGTSLSQDPGKSGRRLTCLRQVREHLFLGLERLFGLVRLNRGSFCPGLSSESSCAPYATPPAPDYLDHYSADCDLCDGQFPSLSKTGQDSLPSQGGAVGLIRTWLLDAWDTIRKHIRGDLRWWVHPYSGEELDLLEPVAFGTMELRIFGDSLVSDLTVKDANHYITQSKLVNKNTDISIEELTQIADPKPIFKLAASLRSAHGVPTQFRATCNPGGPGHLWVKSRYIDPAPLGFEPIIDPDTGLDRVFIPSRVWDNKALMEADPDYVNKIKMSAHGSEALIRAWLYGDWDVIDGAYFDNWNAEKHVIRPFTVPKHWLRFRAMDWGSAVPFCVLWFAVSDGEEFEDHQGNELLFPRGALIVYREYYGMPEGKPNVGLKLTAEEICTGGTSTIDNQFHKGIVQLEKNDTVKYGVASPDMFKQDGGPSVAERMAQSGVIWMKADNRRVARNGAIGGWDQVRSRLNGIDDNPMLYVFSTCTNLIRTLPIMQHDPDRLEDMDDGEDHAVEALRYGAMSRPWTVDAAVPKEFEVSTKRPTFNQLVKSMKRSSSGLSRRI